MSELGQENTGPSAFTLKGLITATNSQSRNRGSLKDFLLLFGKFYISNMDNYITFYFKEPN